MFAMIVGAQAAVQYVILIGCDDQLFHRKSHLPCQVSGENVTKIAGGHRERNGPRGAAQRQCGIKIVNNLRHNTGPVY